MNIYVLYGEDMFNRDGDCSIDKEFISSNEKYTKTQFTEICKKAKEDCKRKYNRVSLFYMVEILTELYGFNKLETCSGYEL